MNALFCTEDPVPRVSEGIKLAESGAVTSCIDLSDGLATAAAEICTRSHAGMILEWEFLPIGENVEEICNLLRKDVHDAVLRWGGEYELLFTFKKERIEDIYRQGVPFSIIGTVDNGREAFIRCDGKEEALGHGVY